MLQTIRRSLVDVAAKTYTCFNCGSTLEAARNGKARAVDGDSCTEVAHQIQRPCETCKRPVGYVEGQLRDHGGSNECRSGQVHGLPLSAADYGAMGGVVVVFFVILVAVLSVLDVGESDGPSGVYTEQECQALRLVTLDDSNSLQSRKDALVDYEANCE